MDGKVNSVKFSTHALRILAMMATVSCPATTAATSASVPFACLVIIVSSVNVNQLHVAFIVTCAIHPKIQVVMSALATPVTLVLIVSMVNAVCTVIKEL